VEFNKPAVAAGDQIVGSLQALPLPPNDAAAIDELAEAWEQKQVAATAARTANGATSTRHAAGLASLATSLTDVVGRFKIKE